MTKEQLWRNDTLPRKKGESVPVAENVRLPALGSGQSAIFMVFVPADEDQSLYGSNSLAPAIATPIGVKRCSILIVPS